MPGASTTQHHRAPAVIPAIVCNHPDDVAEVKTAGDFRLYVRFFDGLEGLVDMGALVHSPHAGVFGELADPARFAEACVEYGAVTWPGGPDLAPDSMYAEIRKNGVWVLRSPKAK
jgi:hypothetical protein